MIWVKRLSPNVVYHNDLLLVRDYGTTDDRRVRVSALLPDHVEAKPGLNRMSMRLDYHGRR